MTYYGRNEIGYRCDTCKRSARMPSNPFGLDVIQRCIFTAGCAGRLHRLLTQQDINDAPVIPPDVEGLENWFQRKVLFTFEQPIKSQRWLIEHNLATKPIVQVQVERTVDTSSSVEELVDVVPTEINLIDLNTVELVFDRKESGIAQCIAVASASAETLEVQATTTSTLQLTNTGVLTLAVPASGALSVSIEYQANPYTTLSYNTIPNGITGSPWVGAQRVYVNGKIYFVKSFDIITGATPTFSPNVITNGTSLRITPAPTPGSMLILYGNAPFSSVDRVTTQYIDAASINTTLPELYYSAGEVFTSSAVAKDTYPPIVIVD